MNEEIAKELPGRNTVYLSGVIHIFLLTLGILAIERQVWSCSEYKGTLRFGKQKSSLCAHP